VYWLENLKRRYHFGEQGVGTIKMILREAGCEVLVWIQLAHNGFQWLVILITVMTMRVLQKMGHFLPCERP
jgi:hypothetical protein